jgi:adenylate cyclase
MLIQNRELLSRELSNLLLRNYQQNAGQDFSAQANAYLDKFLPAHTNVEIRECTILFSDLRGFTHFTEKYPVQILHEILNRYFTCMIEIIEKHGGFIDKLIGDAIMVVFSTSADPLVMATILACSIEMQNAMARINIENRAKGIEGLYMGIGINSGEVLTGFVGSNRHLEYTAIGNAVNVASRVESFTMRGQILISESTYQTCTDLVTVGEPLEISAKGSTGPLTIYELLAVLQPVFTENQRLTRRKYLRVDTDLLTKYQHVVGKELENIQHEGQVINLSYDGMLLLTDEKLDSRTELYFETSLSMFSTDTGQIYAKVIRCIPTEAGYETGLEFTIIDDATAEVIRDYIDKIV